MVHISPSNKYSLKSGFVKRFNNQLEGNELVDYQNSWGFILLELWIPQISYQVQCDLYGDTLTIQVCW